jgi:signal transduction histidine kinase
MIRHYLNLSRIERGELKPARSRVDLRTDVVGPLVDSLEPQIAAVKMRVDNRLGAGVLVHADVNMTREVVENLLTNAAKYGREGGLVSIEAAPAGDFVRVAVRNEGPGIAPERMPNLFRKFAREEGGTAAKRPGTGLGLFVSKHIVEAHGGIMEAASEPGQWAEFRFTLPAYRGA